MICVVFTQTVRDLKYFTRHSVYPAVDWQLFSLFSREFQKYNFRIVTITKLS